MVYIIDCSVCESLDIDSQREFLYFCRRNFLAYIEDCVHLPQIEKRIVKKFEIGWFKNNDKFTKYSCDYWKSFFQFYKSLPIEYRLKKLKRYCEINIDFLVLSFNKDEVEYFKQFEHIYTTVYFQEGLNQESDFSLEVINDNGYFYFETFDQYNLFRAFLHINQYKNVQL